MNFTKVLRIMPFILAGLIVILVCLIIIGSLENKANSSKDESGKNTEAQNTEQKNNDTVDWEKDGKNAPDADNNQEEKNIVTDSPEEKEVTEVPTEEPTLAPTEEPTSAPTETPTPSPEPEEPDKEYGLDFEEKADFAEVKAGSNIREGASENAEIVTTLSEVKTLERTGYNSLWTRVIYNGKECYVATKLVISTGDKITEAPTREAENQTEKNDYVEVKAGSNIRKEPSTDAEIVTTLDKAVRLKRVSGNAEWSKVEYDGKTCYVSNIVVTGTYNEPVPVEPDKNKEDSEKANEGKTSAAGGIFFGSGSGNLICIDPGHQTKGNYDTEAVAPGSTEKKAKVSSGTSGKATGLPEYKLNLSVSLQLKDELVARGYRVVMTRTENDVNISNIERATIANENNVDAFVRIHANGSDNSSVSGIETICQTKGNKYVGSIYSECRSLSDKVLDGIVKATGGKKRGVWETDTMSGINWSKVPVTIVEMGFMTNAEEDKLLSDALYQKKIVKGIADGIDAYFGK